MIAFVLYTVYLFEYDLPIDVFELESIDSCRGRHIYESISRDTDVFDATISLEFKLSYIVPCFHILESLGIRLEYPYMIPIEYICVGEITTSDKYTILARIYIPLPRDFVEDNWSESIFVSRISEDLAILHVEIHSSIDTQIKYPALDFVHES